MKKLKNIHENELNAEPEKLSDLENVSGGANLNTKLASGILAPIIALSSSPTFAKDTSNSNNFNLSNSLSKNVQKYVSDNVNTNSVFENIIKSDLKNKEKFLNQHRDEKGRYLKNTWEGLCFLLGNNKTIEYVKENYPEWEKRLTGPVYSQWSYYSEYENYALMSIAYSLRLAEIENYKADNISNNELISRKTINHSDSHITKDKNILKNRTKKIIIENEDILRSAAKHFDDLDLKDKKIGFLNAGDPYDPNGFLPNRGNALEEYLSMNTTLIRDLSHKSFRKQADNNAGFYTTREDFPPICSGPNENPSMYTILSRLIGKNRDFYFERGIMSRNVKLIRNLGDCKNTSHTKDSTFSWNSPENSANFDFPKTNLANKTFCILSIAGLEDRSRSIVYGKSSSSPIYKLWKHITKKQCRFVLDAFIKEGVKVPFLSAFGAGCFGGNINIVASCFKELLIDEGYCDYFDNVVFPIAHSKQNLDAFNNAFKNNFD